MKNDQRRMLNPKTRNSQGKVSGDEVNGRWVSRRPASEISQRGQSQTGAEGICPACQLPQRESINYDSHFESKVRSHSATPYCACNQLSEE